MKNTHRLSGIALAAACFATPLAALSQDDILRISTPFPFTRLDPAVEGRNYYVFGAAELLMRFEPDGQIVP